MEYARKYNLEINDDNIFGVCNNHRNVYICKKAYKNGYSGYSKCYKKDLRCNGIMHFYDDYTYAECECCFSTWHISDVYDDKSFDINNTIAKGERGHFAYFAPCID